MLYWVNASWLVTVESMNNQVVILAYHLVPSIFLEDNHYHYCDSYICILSVCTIISRSNKLAHNPGERAQQDCRSTEGDECALGTRQGF